MRLITIAVFIGMACPCAIGAARAGDENPPNKPRIVSSVSDDGREATIYNEDGSKTVRKINDLELKVTKYCNKLGLTDEQYLECVIRHAK